MNFPHEFSESSKTPLDRQRERWESPQAVNPLAVSSGGEVALKNLYEIRGSDENFFSCDGVRLACDGGGNWRSPSHGGGGDDATGRDSGGAL